MARTVFYKLQFLAFVIVFLMIIVQSFAFGGAISKTKVFFSEIETDTKISLKKPQFTLYTGSFIKHFFPIDKPDEGYNEHFSNRFLAIGISIDEKKRTFLIIGMLENSYNQQCGVVGFERDWKKINNKWDFVGMYAYTGEFPGLKSSKQCGSTGGVYHTLERITGIGFAPYIYHGIKYNITAFVGINIGIILPNVLAMNIEWRF